MRRMSANVLAIAVFFAVCSAWMVSRSTAEPIVPTVDPSASSAGSQSEELTNAIGRFKARDVEGALKLLQEAVKKDADLPPAQSIMAQWYLQSNALPPARAALEQAIIADPSDPEAYLLLGEIAMSERRITEAELAYLRVESLLANFDKSAKRKNIFQLRIHNGLAGVGEARENWPEVQKQLEAWLKIEPNNAVALQRLARCLVQRKKVTEALEELKKAAKADSDLVTSEAILAQFCEQAGDRENAKKYINLALAVKPKDVRVRLLAARWAFATSQLDLAQEQATAALKIDEKSTDAKILRGLVALFQKDYKTAERYFEEVYLQSPDNVIASNNLALALAEQKDDTKKRRALAYAETNVRQYPKSAEAASTYGWVLYRLGRLEEADTALRAAVSGGSFGADTAYYLAKVDVDRDRPSEAKLLLEVALKNTAPFAMRQEAQALLEQLKASK